MYVTGTFAGKRFLANEKSEFTVRVVPEEMEGKEVESFVCFSKQPLSLEILKGENWIACSGILGCSMLIDETTTFRVSFGDTGKVKMDWYCTKEGKLLKEIMQYADVADPALPEIACDIQDSFYVHEEVEFTVLFDTPAPSSAPRKVQYMFSSMDSVKRIERLIEDEGSAWDGKWMLIDRSHFSTGEMMEFTGSDSVTFRVAFLAWGSFKLHVLVDGVLQATFPFKVLSRLGESAAAAGTVQKEQCVRLEKAPKGCQLAVEGERIYLTYPEKTTQNWWRTQAKECGGYASPNEVYCTVRFISPKPAGWCRTVVESISGMWTTEFRPIPAADDSSCLWSFPVARKVNGVWKELDWCRTGTYYKVTVTFCNLENGIWKEVAAKTWNVKCRHLAETVQFAKVWSSELLYYLRMILNGCTAASAMKAFGTWHKWPSDKIYESIINAHSNFGRFALDNGLVHTAEEMSAVNWIISSGGSAAAQERLGLHGFNPRCREAKSLEAALLRAGCKSWRPSCGCR